MSQFQSPHEALNVVIFEDGTKRVYLHDVAQVANGFKKEDVSVEQNGTQVIVVGVRKEQGANVLAMTEKLETKVIELNQGLLAKNDLYIDWVYDQRPYINTAIDLVKQNVMLGGILAICVLLVFYAACGPQSPLRFPFPSQPSAPLYFYGSWTAILML